MVLDSEAGAEAKAEAKAEADTEVDVNEKIVINTRVEQAPAAVEQLVKLTKDLGLDVDCSCAVALGILCQEMVQAAGLSLFNTVHNQHLGQVSAQAASMKGVIELYRSGAPPGSEPRPTRDSDPGARAVEDVTKKFIELLIDMLGAPGKPPSNSNGGSNGNGGPFTPH